MNRYDFTIIYKCFDMFLPAAWETLKITTLSIIFGLVLGLFIAIMRLSKNPFLKWPASFYVSLIRGTPILLQLLIIYYGLTGLIKIDAFPSAIIAFGIHNSAYIAEIFRGSIISVDIGQKEAARSLGMSKTKAFKRIILPQAFKRAVPSLGNQFIIATKDSSLASAIAVRELLLKAQQLGSSQFKFLEYLIIAGIYYYIITITMSAIVHKIERKLAVSDREV